MPMRQGQQRRGRLQRGHRGPSRQLRCGLRIQPQRGRRDDAQRAFAADEQVAQVVTGVVLAQALQAFPDLPVGQYHFQPQAQLARIAVAHHLRAARVGRQVAADGATALGTQAQRKQHPRVLYCLLQRLEHTTCFHRNRHVGEVDGAYGQHAEQAQDDLLATSTGYRAFHQARIATLRHDRDAGLGACTHHLGHFCGRAGSYYAQRFAL